MVPYSGYLGPNRGLGGGSRLRILQIVLQLNPGTARCAVSGNHVGRLYEMITLFHEWGNSGHSNNNNDSNSTKSKGNKNDKSSNSNRDLLLDVGVLTSKRGHPVASEPYALDPQYLGVTERALHRLPWAMTKHDSQEKAR